MCTFIFLTQYSHVIFSLFFVLVDQVVEVIGEVLEQRVLLMDLQTQNTVQKLTEGAVWDTGQKKAIRHLVGCQLVAFHLLKSQNTCACKCDATVTTPVTQNQMCIIQQCCQCMLNLTHFY